MARADPNRLAPDERLDRFAELLSQDLDMSAISQRMGIGKGAAYVLLGKLRRKYGWQAQ